jgi:ABC-type taurine transport system substrate-binding protein
MEDYSEKRARAAAEAAAEKAANERSVSMATELWNDGMRDMEKIAKLTKLPLDEVKKLFEGKTA